jgi:hypothetical protein
MPTSSALLMVLTLGRYLSVCSERGPPVSVQFVVVLLSNKTKKAVLRRTGCTVVCYVCGRAIARAAEVVTGSGVLLCGVPALAGQAK